MRLDFAALPAADAYRWLASTVTPRPIAWVSTRSADGVDNLAPFSFFQIVCHAPPTLMLSIGPRDDGSEKDTLRNLRERGELVIQLVSAAQVDAMNATAAAFPHGTSEFARCDVSSLPSDLVAPPRVAAAMVAFECVLASIQAYPPVPSGTVTDSLRQHLVFAEVRLAHIDDAAFSDARHLDPAKLDLIGRLGGSAYASTRDVFHLQRP